MIALAHKYSFTMFFIRSQNGPMSQTIRTHTNGELLWHSLHFHLGRQKIQGRRGVLTEADRKELCDRVVNDLRQFNKWLDEEAHVPVGHGWSGPKVHARDEP